MATKTNYNVKVELDPTEFPSVDRAVIWDASSGSFALTSSIGGGGTLITKTTPITATVNPTTTLNFVNGDVSDAGSGVADVEYTLQGVTDNGFITTNTSLFLSNQPLDYNGLTGINATSGFREQGSLAYTFVTPQETEKPIFLLGVLPQSEYPNNYIIYNKDITIYPSGSDGDDTHEPTGGGGNDHGPNLVIGGGQITLSSVTSSSPDPRSGVLLTPVPNIYFFNTDASASISGSLQPVSASAQINYDTSSGAMRFLVGETNEVLKEVLFISKSGDDARIGIGTDKPASTFELKTGQGSSKEAPDFILSVPSGSVTEGAESSRLAFVIEDTALSGSKLLVSGSTGAIYSRVLGEQSSFQYGSLVLEVDGPNLPERDLKAIEIGHGLFANDSQNIGIAVSSSIEMGGFQNPRIFIKNEADENIIKIGNDTQAPPDTNAGELRIFDNDTEKIVFRTYASKDSYINTTGNFGIGTTSPSEKLEVSDNIKAGGFITASNAQFTSIPVGSETTFLTVDSSGNVKTRTSGADGSSGTSGTSGTSPTIANDANNRVVTAVGNGTLNAESNFTFNGSTMSVVGDITVTSTISGNGSVLEVGEIASSAGPASSAGDKGFNAETVTFYSNTVVAGGVYYLGSSAWTFSDADAVSTSKGFMGVSTSTNSNTGMVIRGIVYVFADPGGSVGDVVYLSTATGRLTTTAPTAAGDVVRIMGYKVGTNLVFFNPSNDWVEL